MRRILVVYCHPESGQILAIGHINNEETKGLTGRAALAPISRAASAPIKRKGSAGSAPVPVVASTTGHVRQGDKITEDNKVRQGDNVTEDKVPQR